MALDDTYSRGVGLVIAEFVDPSGVAERRPIGTGFFVTLQNEFDPSQGAFYVVTAAHVIRPHSRTFIRVRARENIVLDDVPISQWIFAEDADVAVAVFAPPLSVGQEIWFAGLPIDEWGIRADDEAPPQLGDRVYFLGLLSGVPEMHKRNIPMCRSGTLGAWNQEGIPYEAGRHITAHLIDCRSFRGFSGSPCFVQWSNPVLVKVDEDQVTLAMRHTTRFIGMLVAHFDDIERQQGNPTLRINIGVGVVIPVEPIRALLDADELKEERRMKAHKEPERREPTLDAMDDPVSMDTPVSLAPADFEDAVRALLNTPPHDENRTD